MGMHGQLIDDRPGQGDLLPVLLDVDNRADQYVSLLIAAGRSAKYIAEQAGHSSAGFTLDTYGHLFESVKPMPVEWPEDLLWPAGLEGSLAVIVRTAHAPSSAV
jgi:hypothetical protein